MEFWVNVGCCLGNRPIHCLSCQLYDVISLAGLGTYIPAFLPLKRKGKEKRGDPMMKRSEGTVSLKLLPAV